jgi:hypothetical protein
MASSTDVSNKINVLGLIRSALNKGFSIADCIREKLDNIADARAKQCYVHHFTNGSPLSSTDSSSGRAYLVSGDDGFGMSLDVAEECLTIHNEKKPSAYRNGFAGIGLNHALANLSQLSGRAIILTRQLGGDIIEVTIDLSESREKGCWNPKARDISVKNLPLWDEYAPNKEHGTVIIVELDDRVSNELTAIADDIYDDVAKRYAGYGELIINLKLTNEDSSVVKYVDVLDRENVPNNAYSSRQMEVYRSNSETRAYYLNGNIQMVRLDLAAPSRAKIQDYPPNKEFIKVCDIQLEHSYLQDADDESGRRKQGETYFQRGDKIISSIPNPSIQAGDFDKRKVQNFANHKVKYDFSGDSIIKTQMNKSRLSTDNIDTVVLKTIEFLKDDWYKNYLKKHKSVQSRDVTDSRTPPDTRDVLAKKVVKMIMNDGKFVTTLTECISKYEADNSQSS